MAIAGEYEWKPIETAPRDGVEIILMRGPRVSAGSWIEWVHKESEYHSNGTYLGEFVVDEGSGWGSWDGGFTEDEPPTHWMPLPKPLKEEVTNGKTRGV